MEKPKKRFIDVEANSVEEAITLGIDRLKLSREKIKIKILSEPQTGLFGMSGPVKAKIRIYY